MQKIRSLVVVLVVIMMMSIPTLKAQDKTIAEVATEAGTFNTLLAAAQATGLDTVLADPSFGPVTVFAPTDEAFAKIPPMVLEYLLKPENKELLTRILSYHVIGGKVLAADVTTMMAPSMEMAAPGGEMVGSQLNVQVTDAGVRVNSATVTATDIEASNGVIHVIDSVILPTIELPEVDPLAVSDNIIIAGSSTVYPVTERMADLFNDEGFAGTITVDSVGTGAGFERFCVNAETDISNASRPVNDEEVAACAGNNRTTLPFYIGIDALAIAVSSENDFVESLTVAQLAAIFSGEAATWADVDPSYPAEAIQLFSPGTDSGTFDYFVETVFDDDTEKILNAPGIQLSEDDNVLVQGVEGSPYAIGYFGFAYYLENQELLRAVAIEGIEPNEASAEAGTYPLSRPLFIYSDAGIMQAKPQVAAFINFYLTGVNEQLGTEEGEIGYFPVSADALNLDKLIWLAATSAS
jgi:phosphate transport system substrate-binding protein